MVLARATQIVKELMNSPTRFPGLRRSSNFRKKASRRLFATHPWVALELTLRARDILGETLQAALDSSDIAAVKERAAQFFDHTQTMITKLKTEIDASKEPRLAKLLSDAQDQLTKQKLHEMPDSRSRRCNSRLMPVKSPMKLSSLLIRPKLSISGSHGLK